MTVITSPYGHDLSGVTAQLPTNCQPGETYYDTTKEALYCANSTGGMRSVSGHNAVITVVATGTNQATAAALSGGSTNNVTGADGTKGVVLPAAVKTDIVRVYNSSSSALKVYPAGTNTINGGAASASVSLPALTMATFIAIDSTNWAASNAAGDVGPITADSITAAVTPFPITGLAAAQGGSINTTGGTSSTSGNAGGAVASVGGTPGATGVGGAVTAVGGIGGATSGNGGAITNTGGAGTNGNATGGAVSNTGGAGQGSAAGGAVNGTGGVGGATGNGGAIVNTGGAGGATSGVGGAIVNTGGAGTAGNSAGGAITGTGGAGQGSAAGGAWSGTGGAGGLTGAGGAIALTTGAGGGTSGAAGAMTFTVGSATSAVGANITMTAGNGAGGTNGGGNINFVPGTAVSTGTPGEIQVNGDSNWIFPNDALTATDATRTIFVCPRPCRLKSVKTVFSTASSSGTLTVEKCTGTTAPGSGTVLLTGTIALSGTANTTSSGTLIATVASLTFATGDRLGIVIAGTMTNLVGGRVTCGLAPV